MKLLNLIEEKISRLAERLKGCRVGICPSDFGRFSSNLASQLQGMDLVGIYISNSGMNHQGIKPIRDPEVFIFNCDAVIAMGRDATSLRLKEQAAKLAPGMKWIELLDPEDPLSLHCLPMQH